MAKKKTEGTTTKKKAEPKAKKEVAVETPVEETIQPEITETPDVIETDKIIVNEGEVSNAPIELPVEIIQHNEEKIEVPEPDQSDDKAYETRNYKELKEVTGKKRDRYGITYVGIKK